MAHAAKLAGAGVVLGSVLAVLTERVVGAVLTNVPEVTMGSLALAATLLIGIALFACLVPALRATRIAPVVALKE